MRPHAGTHLLSLLSLSPSLSSLVRYTDAHALYYLDEINECFSLNTNKSLGDIYNRLNERADTSAWHAQAAYGLRLYSPLAMPCMR